MSDTDVEEVSVEVTVFDQIDGAVVLFREGPIGLVVSKQKERLSLAAAALQRTLNSIKKAERYLVD